MTDNQNVCDDKSYKATINFRNRFKLLNIPPSRYDNLKNSPYLNTNIFNRTFNQDELNMRRKAEILKYNASNSSTKTNGLTKKEKWKLLVNGSSQKRSLSYSFIQNNLVQGTTNYIQTCPSGTIFYTPTSSSNVPGKIMNLYEDPNIPLYMYAIKTDSYGLINEEINISQFDYDKSLVNQYINQTNNIIVSSIYIQKILTPTYTFNIQFPISIFISAKIKPEQSGSFIDTLIIDFTNNPFQTYIYYGESIVSNTGVINNPTYSFNGAKSASFDISLNLSINNSFSGNQYIGMFSINNLILNTQEGYIYDIILKNISDFNISSFKLSSLNDKIDLYENIQYGICANIEFNQLNKFINCTIKNPGSFPSISTYQPLSII